MRKITPLCAQVLLEAYKEEKVAGSLIIPDSVGDKSEIYRIVSKGSLDTPYKANDVVIVKRYAGQHFKMNDKDYWLIHYEDILAKVE